jgi:Protein of unknown function (DUF2878)
MRTLINFVLFQAGWFACILAAAHGRPLLASGAVAAVVAWHLHSAARPGREARLVLAVIAVGLVLETAVLSQGVVRYFSGQPFSALPPHWILALWALFATTLNVTMRWLKGRWWLAALLGAIAAPLSFAAGVRLGAGEFIDTTHALVLIGAAWAVAMPLLMWLSDRFDGIAPEGPASAAPPSSSPVLP